MVKKLRGFTIIELIVIVAIIAVLAVIISVNVISYINKTRDANRKAELLQLKKALELYRADDSNNGMYPSTGDEWWSNNDAFGSHDLSGPNGYIPGLAPTYIGQLPVDPNGRNPGAYDGYPGCTIDNAGYVYRSDGINYKLLSGCVAGSNYSSPDPLNDPVRDGFSFMVCSGEPACSSW